jgi:phage terminase small subunit
MTDKQKKFVEEYLIDLNATQAAIRAGYSPNRASEQAHQLLQKTTVQKAIANAMAKRSKRTGVTQDRVVRELAKIAFLDMTQVVDSYGRIKDDAAPEDRACIESIKYKSSSGDQGKSVEREVKVASKLKALELLGKHLGMYSDKLSIEGAVPIVISGADELKE